jgi:GTPase SAR1 family protein
MWDTSGNEKYGHINKSYYKGTSVFVFMFDLSDLESFEKVKKMIQHPDFVDHMEYNKNNERSPLVVLIGSKSDL